MSDGLDPYALAVNGLVWDLRIIRSYHNGRCVSPRAKFAESIKNRLTGTGR
jgi:hypothetical protein